jgi:chromosome segregation ATPase
VSRKDARIQELEEQLKMALSAVAKMQEGVKAQCAGIAENHAAYEKTLAERDAAFEPLKAEAAELKHENERLRREFKGFLDSITFWKGEL